MCGKLEEALMRVTGERNTLSEELQVVQRDAERRRREGEIVRGLAEMLGCEAAAAVGDLRAVAREVMAKTTMMGQDGVMGGSGPERGREMAGGGGAERGERWGAKSHESDGAEAEKMRMTLEKLQTTAERDLAQGGLLSELAQRTNESVRRGREEARRSLARCRLSLQQVIRPCCDLSEFLALMRVAPPPKGVGPLYAVRSKRWF